jgi:anti-sigma factor RsiW
MTHPTEDSLAAYALGLLAESESQRLKDHLEACTDCDRLVEEYRDMGTALREWREAPGPVAAETHGAILQRLRLHRLLHQLFVDAELRRRAGDDPARVLAAHGIAPTPALLAAFKEIGSTDAARFPGELDERITKWRRVLEWFPGGPPPVGN